MLEAKGPGREKGRETCIVVEQRRETLLDEVQGASCVRASRGFMSVSLM